MARERDDLSPREIIDRALKKHKPICSTCKGRGTIPVAVTHKTNPNLDRWESEPCPKCQKGSHVKGRLKSLFDPDSYSSTFKAHR